jgi:DNA-binding IclR family transcriptional regulator
MAKIERALAVLERLTSGRPPPTHADLMRELGIQRSTLSDLLSELRRFGYVDVRDRRYTPGLRLVRFVHQAAYQADLGATIRPTLESLRDATGETAVWVIEDLDRGTSTAIEQAESPQPVRYVAEIGRPYPLESTSAGRVFLAFGERRPPHLERLEHLDEELGRVRRNGYATLSLTDRAMIAAPVFDSSTSLLGVVSIVGPLGRIEPEAIWPVLAKHLEELAQRLES